MWAVSTVLTTRVYMNLVWLAKKPLITTMDPKIPSIRMHAYTLTEAQEDYGTLRRPGVTMPSVDEGVDPK
jgi:hypothetical protein